MLKRITLISSFLIASSCLGNVSDFFNSMRTDSLSPTSTFIYFGKTSKSLKDAIAKADDGGDVVGNGGDEFRKMLIQEGNFVLNELKRSSGMYYKFLNGTNLKIADLSKSLSEKRIRIVKDIKTVFGKNLLI